MQGVQTMSRDAQNLGKKDALHDAVKMMKCESAIFKNVKRKQSSKRNIQYRTNSKSSSQDTSGDARVLCHQKYRHKRVKVNNSSHSLVHGCRKNAIVQKQRNRHSRVECAPFLLIISARGAGNNNKKGNCNNSTAISPMMYCNQSNEPGTEQPRFHQPPIKQTTSEHGRPRTHGQISTSSTSVCASL